jgi:repressor LexA
MSLQANLSKLMELRGISATELSAKADVPTSRISEIVTGKTKNPQMKTLSKIAKALGVDVAVLTSEEIVSFAGSTVRPSNVLAVNEIPVLGRISAGFPNIASQEVLDYISIPGAPKNSFALIVRGASMEPTFRDGDYVLFIENGDCGANDVLIVLDEWGEAMVKRLKEREGRRFLVSDNPAYPVIEPNEHYRTIGKVVKVWRDIKF